MYYGKYDYYVLAEGSKEIDASIGNYNNEVVYGTSKKKNYFKSDSNIRKSYESFYKDIFNTNMKEVVMKYCGPMQCKKIVVAGNVMKTIASISIDLIDVTSFTPIYKLYINDSQATFDINTVYGMATITNIAGSFSLKEYGNSYTLYVMKDSPITINGYDSDSYTNRTQFLTMESLEGSFDWKREHSKIEKKEDVFNKQVQTKSKKYIINIQEPEHDSSLLDILKKNDIIKIIKLYPDRVEEFFNCSLVNSIVISEESDVNKINFELASTNLYIRYFDENGIITGGDLVD
jgi:hypothetical protein